MSCGVTPINEKKRIYWDACAWLGLINGEAAKSADLEVVWKKAERGQVEIWTSAFCLAEVYKVKCEDGKTGLQADQDKQIDDLFQQDFVNVVQVDIEVAEEARRLLRTIDKLKKPSDAIHLATALVWNLDQLHTYDSDDLLGITINRRDGQRLDICTADMVDGETLFTP